MNDTLRIRTLTDRFFEGMTTLEEERELYEYYSHGQPLPADLLPYRDMFLDFAAVPYVATLSQQPPKLARRRRPYWSAIAAAVLLLTAAGAVVLLTNRLPADDECVAFIYGERTTDPDVVLGEMQKTMATVANDGSNVVEEQLRMMFGNE